jgi:hypothetical protein
MESEINFIVYYLKLFYCHYFLQLYPWPCFARSVKRGIFFCPFSQKMWRVFSTQINNSLIFNSQASTNKSTIIIIKKSQSLYDSFYQLKFGQIEYGLLVNLVVINARLGRKNHDSISIFMIWKRLKLLMSELAIKTD